MAPIPGTFRGRVYSKKINESKKCKLGVIGHAYGMSVTRFVKLHMARFYLSATSALLLQNGVDFFLKRVSI
jgi:hypothetical protein